MKKTLTSKEISWQVLAEPTAEELAEFVRETGLLPIDAEFIAQERQRPEVAERPEYILILIQVPVFAKAERITHGVNVYFVVRETSVSTLQFEPLAALEALYGDLEKDPEKQEEYFSTSLVLALYLIRRLLATAFAKLERLSKHIEITEDAVFHGNERKMVEEVALLTRDVMDFRRVIRPQRRLFYESPHHGWVNDEVREEWRRLSQNMEKVWDILDNLHESLRELARTNQSLLEHKENQLLRILTLYSIFAIPVLVLVQPIFAPGEADASQGEKMLFWALFVVLVAAFLVVLWQFRGKRIF